MKYILNPYKKIYHKLVYNIPLDNYQSKCRILMGIKEGAGKYKLVLIPPRSFRPCKKCYREEVTLVYPEGS